MADGGARFVGDAMQSLCDRLAGRRLPADVRLRVSTRGIRSVRLDLANLQDVPLGVRGNHEEPLVHVHVAAHEENEFCPEGFDALSDNEVRQRIADLCKTVIEEVAPKSP